VGVRPSGARTRADFLAFVAKALDGLAQPIGPQLETGYIYYVVMETLGEARAHRNDNILFVGEDVPLGRFENATVPLRAAGVLRE